MKKYIIVLGLSILLSGVVGYATSETWYHIGDSYRMADIDKVMVNATYMRTNLNYSNMILAFLITFGSGILLVSINGKWITNNLAHAKRSLTKNS